MQNKDKPTQIHMKFTGSYRMDETDYSCRNWLFDGSSLCTRNIRINNDDVFGQANHSTNVENVENKKRKWPFLIWLILKILCVFYHRKVTRKRICYSCYVKNVSYHSKREVDSPCKEPLLLDPICLEYEYDGENWANENKAGLLLFSLRDQNHNCDVCNMTPWNCLGEAKEYSDSDIGVASWNSPYSKLFSVMGVTFAIAFILYDFGFYIHHMLGHKRDLLHLISYTGFLACLSTYPFLNICSKIRSFLGQEGKFEYLSWATTLNLRFITKRLQVLDLPKKGLPGKFFLTLCLLWPSCNALYRVYIYIFILKSRFTVHLLCTLGGVGTVMIMWGGCFAYVLFLMRLSFQREFMLTISYMKKNEGKLDNCRNCLNHMLLDFNCFRKFITLYVAVMVPFTVLEVTATLTRQYRLGENCQYLENGTRGESSINILIWSNTVMFIALNVVAVGGLDMNNMWNNFLLRIIQLQTAQYCSFWRKIFTHLKRNQGDYSTTNLTMVFAVVSFYMALQLGDEQDIFYGQKVARCSMVNVTQPTNMVGYSVF